MNPAHQDSRGLFLMMDTRPADQDPRPPGPAPTSTPAHQDPRLSVMLGPPTPPPPPVPLPTGIPGDFFSKWWCPLFTPHCVCPASAADLSDP